MSQTPKQSTAVLTILSELCSQVIEQAGHYEDHTSQELADQTFAYCLNAAMQILETIKEGENR